MEEDKINGLKQFLGKEMLLLNLKRNIVKKAQRNFNISREEVETAYLIVRSQIKKQAAKRAWTYLLIGSIFLGVGLFGSLTKTGFIFIGAILAGAGCVITAIGLFRLALRKSVND
ncbi:hypothetical protein [Fluviicola taffensis]|uniref:hypothetical protein n=1 Tax=Fluviicola taffensis TaxID=191579 RepID=UPI0031380B9C